MYMIWILDSLSMYQSARAFCVCGGREREKEAGKKEIRNDYVGKNVDRMRLWHQNSQIQKRTYIYIPRCVLICALN